MLAFHQALLELEAEGGVAGRAARYRRNHETLTGGMARLGFHAYVPDAYQSHIITTYLYPEHLRFSFEDFYGRLNDRGYVIYPGKVTEADCFRIGTIGRLFTGDMEALLAAIARVLDDMGIPPSTHKG
jgi:2-aminoethylphosphonate-pyruvate transaminase